MELVSVILIALKLASFCNELNGQNCSVVKELYQLGKTIQAQQAITSDILHKNRFHMRQDDPYAALFGEDMVRDINVNHFNSSKVLLNAIRIFNELFPNSNRSAIAKCLSENERCPIRFGLRCSPHRPWRSLDGACNKLGDNWLGASFTPFERLLPAEFDDTVSTIRMSFFSRIELPSPRIVGNIIDNCVQGRLECDFSPEGPPVANEETLCSSSQCSKGKNFVLNYGALIFGQLLAHDIGSRLLARTVVRNSPGERCCTYNHKRPLAPEISYPTCLPIGVPVDDPYYSQFNVTCLNYIRSESTIPHKCNMATMEKVNGVSHFADMSFLYANDEMDMLNLRTTSSGKMKINKFMVLSLNEFYGNGEYYKTGDSRVNQTPMLALWQSVFLRMHNKIAEEMSKIHNTWNDDKIFNNARRLNQAIYQHILFHEWVPLMLGRKFSEKENIICNDNKAECLEYNNKINPSVTNDFNHGSFRALHACIPQHVNLYSVNGKITTFNLTDIIGKSDILDFKYHDVLGGMLKDPIYCDTSGYNDEIRNKLFRTNEGFGADLFGIDIQRGRDHGVAPYFKYYELCTGNIFRAWQDLQNDFSAANIQMLGSIYESVFDMDLITGVMLEKKINRIIGVVGRCIMADQMYRLKYGDRFFYKFTNGPDAYSKEQVNAIEKMTMAKLLCINTNLEHVPKQAFTIENLRNSRISCADNRQFEFNLF